MAIHLVSDNTPKLSAEKRTRQPASDINAEEIQHTLHLAGLLQTSLEIESILAYFCEAGQHSVQFDAARYSYEPLDIQYQYGKAKVHSCTYRLTLANEALGQIEFSRQQPFSETEIIGLETLLSQLIYPLRNAIWYQRALQASQRDPLTGAFNRAAMDETLLREVELAHRNDTPLSLVVLDVDHFKQINDNYGHSAGDSVLKTLVTCINSILRKSDMLFRYGGEEFTLLLSGTNLEGAFQVAERVRQAIERHHFNHAQNRIPVTASLGVTCLKTADSIENLFEKADQALYNAKQQGRNRVISTSA
ncbi:MAG: GGDEF domain-containing protein [Thioalkalispiraceae bacterium]|jgi:diguanylate cyclase (GGDEF)-like protein